MIILLEINPLNKLPVICAILILMASTFVIGWVIGWLIPLQKSSRLNQTLRDREGQLDYCRQIIRSNSALPVLANENVAGDNLKIIEGVGPNVERLFNGYGILTFSQLADAKPARLLEILREASPDFHMYNPSSWPRQAMLARDGKLDELKILQFRLNDGKTF